jgi:CRISPR-associated exonuclease Cas4
MLRRTQEAWLMSRNLVGNQQDESLAIGRLISETTYKNSKKEVRVGNNILDIVRSENGQIVLVEVKKSSKAIESSEFQLLYYIYTLKNHDIMGEIRVPTEKKIIKVVLTNEKKLELEELIKEITDILIKEKPPKPERVKYCKTCSYNEFCWA